MSYDVDGIIIYEKKRKTEREEEREREGGE